MREPSAWTTNTPLGGWEKIICEPSLDHSGADWSWASPSKSASAWKPGSQGADDPNSTSPSIPKVTVFKTFFSLLPSFKLSPASYRRTKGGRGSCTLHRRPRSIESTKTVSAHGSHPSRTISS